MNMKRHNLTSQTNQRHREEEPHINSTKTTEKTI